MPFFYRRLHSKINIHMVQPRFCGCTSEFGGKFLQATDQFVHILDELISIWVQMLKIASFLKRRSPRKRCKLKGLDHAMLF